MESHTAISMDGSAAPKGIWSDVVIPINQYFNVWGRWPSLASLMESLYVATPAYACMSHNAVAFRRAIHSLSEVIYYTNARATVRGVIRTIRTITSLTCMIVMVRLASKYGCLR